MRQLIELWVRVLGTPPSEQQFVIWLESHAADVVRHGILKAAAKNQQMGGTMRYLEWALSLYPISLRRFSPEVIARLIRKQGGQ